MSGFRVDDAVLDAHARQVDALAARLGVAAAAGRSMPDDAYGIVGRGFAGAAQLATELGATMITGASVAADLLAGGLRLTGAAYRQVEERNTGGIGQQR